MSTFRLYFNRCEDWPQIWSLDEGPGTPESNVCDWRCEPGCLVSAGRVGAVTDVVDRAREPLAWNVIEAAGVSLIGGVAVFVGPVVVGPVFPVKGDFERFGGLATVPLPDGFCASCLQSPCSCGKMVGDA